MLNMSFSNGQTLKNFYRYNIVLQFDHLIPRGRTGEGVM